MRRAVGIVGLLCVLMVAPPASSSAAGSTGGQRPSAVSVHITRAGAESGLRSRPDLRWRQGTGAGAELVEVDPSHRYQRLSAGFGVALTDTAAWVIREKLPRPKGRRVMRKLFSPAGGIGLSYLRAPIGGTDYVVNVPYTYDDVPPGDRDPELRRFTLRHDRAYVLPAIRQALRLNPRMTVMANPWTPPAWMKTDDSLIPTEATESRLRPDAFGALARYLVRFVREYRRAGVEIDQLGVQNEPLNPFLGPGIPGMYMPANDQARLIRDHLAPRLRRSGLDPDILIWDYFYPRGPFAEIGGGTEYIPEVMAEAGPDVDGISLHCYFSDERAGTDLHLLYPRLPQFQTECASYLSQVEPAQMAIRTLRNWAEGVQLWNAALDESLGPKVGTGCVGFFGPHRGQDCIAPVVVDTRRQRYRLTADYWQLGQFSRFIELGARRIASTTPSECSSGVLDPPPCGLEDVAFRNPDGERVVVATANDGRAHRLRLVEGRWHAFARVPDGAVVTFTWDDGRR